MCCAICWKNVLVVRPQPGQLVTCGVKLRRPSDWSICCATCTSSVAVAAGRGRQRHADRVADALLEQDAEPRSARDDALGAQARFGQAQVQRVVASGGEHPVDVDQVLHARTPSRSA